MPSTSSPPMVRLVATSTAVASILTYCFSHSKGTRIGFSYLTPKPLKLTQEAQIVFQVEAQIRHAGLEHMDTLDAQTEGEPAVLLRVDPIGAEDVRMHHSRSADLQPAALPTDGVVHARFDERKEVRTEAHQRLRAKKRAGERPQGALQVRHGDIVVHHEGIHLMECVVMGGIYGLIAEAPANRRDTEGRATLRHDPALQRGRLGTEQARIRHKERVLFVHGRVVFRIVYGGEVISILLQLRAIHKLEPHAAQDLLDLY